MKPKRKPIDIDLIRTKIKDGTIYKEFRYKRWRERVFKRDGYTCQYPDCKQPHGSLNAHHIKMKYYFPELIFDIRNGITLCYKHHKKIHDKGSDEFVKLFQKIVKANTKKPKKRKKKVKTKKKLMR